MRNKIEILKTIQEQLLVQAEKILIKSNNEMSLGDVAKDLEKGYSVNEWTFIAPMHSNKAQGLVAMGLEKSVAIKIAQNYVGTQVVAEAEIKDATCEIFNHIFGHLKGSLSSFDFEFQVDPYKIVDQKGVFIFAPEEHQVLSMSLSINNDPVTFIIAIKKPSVQQVSLLQRYKPVNIESIPINSALPFDLYYHLEKNNKLVHYKGVGDVFTPEQQKKFRNYMTNMLFIPTVDYDKYVKVFAEDLLYNFNNSAIAPEKRKEALLHKINHTVEAMFYDEESLAQNIDSTVDALLKVVGSTKDMRELLDVFVGVQESSNDFQGHCMRVVGYAMVAAIGLGIDDKTQLNDISTGAFLHDIGFIRLPIELFEKSRANFTPEDMELYEKHPTFSIDVLKESNSALSEGAKKIIFEHHEHANGRGFPRHIRVSDFDIAVNLVSFADDFDYYKKGKMLKTAVSSAKAIEYLVEKNKVLKKFPVKFIKQISEFLTYNNLQI